MSSSDDEADVGSAISGFAGGPVVQVPDTSITNRLRRLDGRRGVTAPTRDQVSGLNVQTSPGGSHLQFSHGGDALDGQFDMTLLQSPGGTVRVRAINQARLRELAMDPFVLSPPLLDNPPRADNPLSGMGHLNTRVTRNPVADGGTTRDRMIAAVAVSVSAGQVTKLSSDSGHYNQAGDDGRRIATIQARTDVFHDILSPTATDDAEFQFQNAGMRRAHREDDNFRAFHQAQAAPPPSPSSSPSASPQLVPSAPVPQLALNPLLLGPQPQPQQAAPSPFLLGPQIQRQQRAIPQPSAPPAYVAQPPPFQQQQRQQPQQSTSAKIGSFFSSMFGGSQRKPPRGGGGGGGGYGTF